MSKQSLYHDAINQDSELTCNMRERESKVCEDQMQVERRVVVILSSDSEFSRMTLFTR